MHSFEVNNAFVAGARHPRASSRDVAILRCALSSIEHRANQALAMATTGNDDTDHMHGDESDQAPGEQLVHALHRLVAPIAIGGVEPAGQTLPATKGCSFAGEIGKNGLRDVVREVGIAADLAERGGIDEVDVAFDEVSECYFRPSPGVLAK